MWQEGQAVGFSQLQDEKIGPENSPQNCLTDMEGALYFLMYGKGKQQHPQDLVIPGWHPSPGIL